MQETASLRPSTCWQQHVNFTVSCKICDEKAESGGNNKKYIYINRRHRIDEYPIRRIIRESIRTERAMKEDSVGVMNTKDDHFGGTDSPEHIQQKMVAGLTEEEDHICEII